MPRGSQHRPRHAPVALPRPALFQDQDGSGEPTAIGMEVHRGPADVAEDPDRAAKRTVSLGQLAPVQYRVGGSLLLLGRTELQGSHLGWTSSSAG